MTIRVALQHRTRYRYDRAVSLSPHEVRLRPAPHCRTPIEDYSLQVRPAKHFLNWQQDPYGNWVARVIFPEKTAELEIVVDLVADMTVINPFDFFVDPDAERYPFDYGAGTARELAPYLAVEPAGPRFAALAQHVRDAHLAQAVGTVEFLVAANRAVREAVDYLVRMEAGVQAPERTLERGQGSCRDSAWLLAQLLRHFGIAARFASGYLIQLAADDAGDGRSGGPKDDFADLHAWCEAYVPGAGWIGLDATSGLLAGEGHIPLACAALPTRAGPVSGRTEVADSKLEFDITVTRIDESPRPTRPFTESQWEAIDALGRQVDRELAAGDVRLTMGGEPTFVAADEPTAPEWNWAALSEGKLERATQLLARLRERFAPEGLPHFGRGKWYSGEPQPRWALRLVWRRDGAPLWRLPLGRPEGSLPGDEAGARRFAAHLTEALGARRDALAGPSPPAASGEESLVPTVQARDGRLWVSMPALATLDDYARALSAVESTARALQVEVRIEGHEPPDDARLLRLAVTPDPGVIEVNLPPAGSWDELTRHLEALYEEAHGARLTAEKFMRDGRHAGTGGGHHVTLGGPTLRDSPLLRRPDLIRSLVAYWQNHPALSYLFSGLFVGPTSQSPRVDETRPDALHELEIAFEQLAERFPPGREAAGPVEALDGILRHFLVDLTGNRHRAEFCIDKLCSPDDPAGRQGLLELRGFEMAPHARMALLQALLLRALVARFWVRPHVGRLVRWGPRLHDDFMLPHYVAQDLREVVEELDSAGYPFRIEWFAPFLELRFPRCGQVSCQGIGLALRQAIEPWPVLGDQAAQTGSSRPVDSSVERLEVKATRFDEARFAVTCNGRVLPMTSTGRPGEFVAGVRYRVRAPAASMHPTVPIQAPLVFDLVDRWNGRSLGGCTYRAGVGDDAAPPVDAREAAARRLARFERVGHAPGPVAVMREARSATFPLTLDLRKKPLSPAD